MALLDDGGMIHFALSSMFDGTYIEAAYPVKVNSFLKEQWIAPVARPVAA